MSWTFQLQNINRSFDRIATWYTEFMRRTEISFKAQERRIKQLEEQLREQRAGPGPSDEQVERVLRKILAEKFSTPPSSQPASTPINRENFFVQDPKETMYPNPVRLDPASLFVEPNSVPSKAYAETFQMLESGLRQFPNGNLNQFEHDVYDDDDDDEYDDDAKDIKMSIIDSKRPRFSNSV